MTADGWSANNTKALYLGMTAHWIDVDKGKWSLQSEVIGFQAVSGEHSGWNLGQYFVGLCNHMGICNTGETKVCLQLFIDVTPESPILFLALHSHPR